MSLPLGQLRIRDLAFATSGENLKSVRKEKVDELRLVFWTSISISDFQTFFLAFFVRKIAGGSFWNWKYENRNEYIIILFDKNLDVSIINLFHKDWEQVVIFNKE